MHGKVFSEDCGKVVPSHFLKQISTVEQVEQACEKQSSSAQAQLVPKKANHGPVLVQELAEKNSKAKVRSKLGPEIGVRCYLLMVEVAERRVLGSLSVPGIFQGPGDTVAFLPDALLLVL